MGFSNLSVPEQIERARLIVFKMTGNATYATPNPSLASVTAANDALEDAYNISRNRDKVLVAAMRLRRKELLFIISQLAAYVQQASDGDEEKISSSGFSVRGKGTPRPVIAGMVHDVRLSDGSKSGRVKVDWNKADDAVIYLVEYSLDSSDSAEFKIAGITTSLHKEIGDYTPGQKLWVRITALGREEAGPASETVSIIVR